MDLEPHGSCGYDYVRIYLGQTTGSPAYGSKYCGTTVPAAVMSEDEYILIKFHSDNRSGGNGFKFSWQFIGEITVAFCFRKLLRL